MTSQCHSLAGPRTQAAGSATHLRALVGQEPGHLGESDVVAGHQPDLPAGAVDDDGAVELATTLSDSRRPKASYRWSLR